MPLIVVDANELELDVLLEEACQHPGHLRRRRRPEDLDARHRSRVNQLRWLFGLNREKGGQNNIPCFGGRKIKGKEKGKKLKTKLTASSYHYKEYNLDYGALSCGPGKDRPGLPVSTDGTGRRRFGLQVRPSVEPARN